MSEDDSAYDTATNDKSSQGSGGSGGLDAVSHEIPIMIEAEAPPSMMQPDNQKHNQYQNYPPTHQNTNNHYQQYPANPNDGPVPPLLGQVRKSPQYATRTTSNNEEGNNLEPPSRSSRCSSAPPQMIDQTGHTNSPNNKSGNPQSRSATVPISPHNSIPKPFVAGYKSMQNSPRSQDPIMEENVQNQQQPTPQHHEHGEEKQYTPYGHPQDYYQHPQDGWTNQTYYPQQQQPEFDQLWQQFYGNDPRYYEQNYQQPAYHPQPQQHQPQQQQQPKQQESSRTNQRPSVIRNIPIFIEGHDRPVVNEERASSLSSSPINQNYRPQPHQRQAQQQPQYQQREQPGWRHTQPMFINNPPYGFHKFPTNPQYYQKEPTHQYHQEPHQHHVNQPQHQQYQQQQPQAQKHQQPHTQKQQQQAPHAHPAEYQTHEIPIQTEQSSQAPPRQASPQPPPPPVKLTPLQKIEQVRTNNEEYMKKVDNFEGTKKDREFLLLDEMLTRALISLDDIDPDGNDEIRQARRNLIKDINSKISLLEKKASLAEEKTTKNEISEVKKAKSPSPDKNAKDTGDKGSRASSVTANGTKDDADSSKQEGGKSGATENSNSLSSNKRDNETKTEGNPLSKEAIPCPAPAIPLPEK